MSEHNYLLRDRWPVPRTVAVPAAQCFAHPLPPLDRDPEVSFSSMSTADAMLHFAILGDRKRKVSGLNFANGINVGGGYKTGAVAQEEDLCRRMTCLYTSLNNAKRDALYPFGPSTCASRDRPAKYCDVLWTKDVILARSGDAKGFDLLPPEQQVPVSLVSAAAPNLRFASPPELCDQALLYESVKAILIASHMKQPEVTTVVLGAWGCGAFGGDPKNISELFCRALVHDRLGRLYREVHFAIPRFGEEDHNADVFRETFRREGVCFRDLDLEG